MQHCSTGVADCSWVHYAHVKGHSSRILGTPPDLQASRESQYSVDASEPQLPQLDRKFVSLLTWGWLLVPVAIRD